ncbi:MAG: FAD-binding protein [Deltaproteobacteria bacterium]|nr:FAD-binding protein [Deltaproteobacteria bacterium]MBW2089103.1 FAD-binding protein [Deltaproteobacteria bacterium]
MALTNSAFRKLQKIVGKSSCSRKKEDLVCYAYDATAQSYLPDAVCFPGNTKEVSTILSLANQEGFFVIPRGSGSGMTGGSLAVSGGVILVMARFSRILEIDKGNLIAHVEPGVVTGRFHRAVEKEGLFYPPDPASSEFATLGGNMAECAGGPRAVKYGVTRDYVLGLEAVLATGEIIHTGVQTSKGVVGYDLTRLLIGSEGTLGIITQMTLRLLPLPEAVRAMTAVFDKLETAAETVSEVIRRGIIPRTLEFMDNASIRCAESRLKIGLPVEAEALLLIEVDGKVDETDVIIKQLRTVCMSMGAKNIKIADTKEEADNLWKARKAISPALYQFAPDKINEDIVVPRSKIPDMVRKINSLKEETGLIMVSFGHAGDGNIHFNIMLDKKNKTELKKAEYAIDILFDYTLELGGTISGEHGVGITKSAYIEKEIGSVELNLMKKIKKVFDPKGILNPGKIFPS